MACLGFQFASVAGWRQPISGGVLSEVVNCRARRIGGWRRGPRMCVDHGGSLYGAAAYGGDLRLARTAVETGDRQTKPMASPELDRLLEDSVTEIVRNINKGPLLVQIYDEDSNNLRVVVEKASSDDWPLIKRGWEGGKPTPGGVILVEELGGDQQLATDSTKVWGLVVQGRGGSCPSCYILKTCQIQCCFGFTTHFAVAKVNCFGQSLDFHLNRMWLQK